MTASVQRLALSGQVRHLGNERHIQLLGGLEQAASEAFLVHDESDDDVPLELMIVRIFALRVENDAHHPIVQVFDVGDSVHENVWNRNRLHERKIGVHGKRLLQRPSEGQQALTVKVAHFPRRDAQAMPLSRASDAQLGGYATGSRFREEALPAEWNGWLISGYASGKCCTSDNHPFVAAWGISTTVRAAEAVQRVAS